MSDTASKSTSELITELCTFRNQLRQVIAACKKTLASKKVLAAMEPAERMTLLDALIEAERKLS